ncbi:hypothetical protein [Ekhidna sp.]|jgi:hypothetical protein|uniref:hypothetical protein n=1 Tax=Ekhidna sp. TaxID=2608089 RepID=UPI0032EFF37C
MIKLRVADRFNPNSRLIDEEEERKGRLRPTANRALELKEIADKRPVSRTSARKPKVDPRQKISQSAGANLTRDIEDVKQAIKTPVKKNTPDPVKKPTPNTSGANLTNEVDTMVKEKPKVTLGANLTNEVDYMPDYTPKAGGLDQSFNPLDLLPNPPAPKNPMGELDDFIKSTLQEEEKTQTKKDLEKKQEDPEEQKIKLTYVIIAIGFFSLIVSLIGFLKK